MKAKCCVITSVAIIIILIAALVVVTWQLLLLKSKNNGKGKKEDPEKLKDEVEFVKIINSVINQDIDPCDDFFEFACGKWLENHTITHAYEFKEVGSELPHNISKQLMNAIEKINVNNSQSKTMSSVRKIYDSCIGKQNNTKQFISLLKEVYAKLKNSESVETFIGELYAAYGVEGMFKFEVDMEYDPQYYTFAIYQPECLKADNKSIMKTLTEIQKRASIHFNNLKEMTEAIVEFNEIVCGKYNISTVLYRNDNMSKLAKEYEYIEWDALFDKLGIENITRISITIEQPDYVKAINEPFIKKLNVTVSGYVLKMYNFWRFATKYRDIGFGARGSHANHTKMECLSLLTEYMPFAMGNLYLDVVGKDNAKKTRMDAMNMTKKFKKAFSHMIEVDNKNWTKTSKENAQSKLNSIYQGIGYPDWLMKQDKIDEFYKDINKQTSKNYLQNVILLQKSQIGKEIEKYKQSVVDKSGYAMNITSTIAQFSQRKNLMIIPFALLQLPYYNMKYPEVFKYGVFGGRYLGHEMAKGFDYDGVDFNENGTLNKHWMDFFDYTDFQKRRQRLVDQYSQNCCFELGSDRVCSQK